MKKANITFSLIAKQLLFDLIGKDSQRGITLTYGWLANQFGHFALGYIPVLLFYGIYTQWLVLANPILWALLSTMILWTVFEAYNFLGPLLKPSRTNPFKPDWFNVGFDTLTDLLFFYTGSFAAILLYEMCFVYLICFLLLFVLTFFLFAYWYPLKMYTQYAYFPFQSRISAWTNDISDEQKQIVLTFISSNTPQHIIITGPENSGKTSLAVSIATELTIKKQACFYTTGIKLLSFLQDSDTLFQNKFSLPWSWRNVSCVVVDDINSYDSCSEILSVDMFKQSMQDSDFSQQNNSCLHNTSFIWVVGKEEVSENWEDFMKSCNVSYTRLKL